MRVSMKNGNNAGTTLYTHTLIPLVVAFMQALGLKINIVIAINITDVKTILDLPFNIQYYIQINLLFMQILRVIIKNSNSIVAISNTNFL